MEFIFIGGVKGFESHIKSQKDRERVSERVHIECQRSLDSVSGHKECHRDTRETVHCSESNK